ncbi:MAG TPA: efflux RND transporter periplasmic adaptor subunit [Terriglobales bacterium]|nr:efflux RND transporter periplasmic adaptor subunit [Terriglobales bacterium]
MAKKIFLTLGIALIVIGGLAFAKFQQVQAAMKQMSFTPPPTAVTTIVVKNDNWSSSMKSVGTVVPVQGVTVSADLPGIVDKITFQSGKVVQAGDVLVQLDTRQERAQLAAAEAQRDLARLNYNRMKTLVEQGAIARADYDQAEAEKSSTEAKVGEIRATIERKTVRAPFSGALGIRQVNLGQYLSPGSPIVPLQSLNPIYVNFGVPQQNALSVKVGQTVHLTASDIPGLKLQGRVSAIDSVIDEATRNVNVQVTVSNPKGTLRPGMFVEAELQTGAAQSIMTVPASAINYAPFGDSIFVISDLKDPNGKQYRGVKQQFVKVGPARGDQVAVLSGIKPGEEIVTSGTFRLRNGAPITVNNSVQPSNSPDPKPEDN